MLTKAVSLCAVFAISVVTANPVLQALVSQTCPICEQNSLKNQLQNVLLQQTSSYFQPYAQMLMNQPIQGIVQPEIPTKRSCSICPQNIQNPNYQVPTCQQQCNNQPYCPNQRSQTQQNNQISDTINQILSNPTLRTILDPETRIYNQNGNEVPKNGHCNDGQPNVINNYIIVPPEILQEDNKSGPKNDVQRRKTRKGNGNRRPKPKTVNIETGNKVSQVTNAEVVQDVKPIEIEVTPNDKKHKKRRRQKNRNPEVKVKIVNENLNKENNQIESSQPIDMTKEKEKVQEEITHQTIENVEQTTISTDNVNYEIKNIKSENNNNSLTNNDKKVIVNQELSKSSMNQTQAQLKVQIQDSKNSTNKKARRKTKQPFNIHTNVGDVYPTKNPREEAVIKDFRQKFPNIPEEVVRDLLAHMKRQLEKQNLGAPTFYYPQFSISYDQLYRNPFVNFPPPAPIMHQPGVNFNVQNLPTSQKPVSNKQNKSKTRRKNRRKNRQRKPRPENNNIDVCDTTTERTPTTNLNDVEMSTIPPTTTTSSSTTTVAPTTTTEILTTITESLPTVEEATEPMKVVVSSEIIKEVQTVETTTSKVTEEPKPEENFNTFNKNEAKMSELGTEDVVPIIYMNDLIDEYYPDFTGDHQYYSNEDFSFIRLDDERYHYTTDKNFQMEELNRERRRFEHDENKRRRPGYRYIFRLKNRDKFRPKSKFNGRERSKTSTTHTFLGMTEKPLIKVTIKYEDKVSSDVKNKEDIRAESEEHNTEKNKTDLVSEEIQFRTPPTLEKIDFETRQINKKIFFNDDIDLKTSSYSDAKTPQYISNEKVKTNKQKPIDQIETVYARSKVVTYGKSKSDENSAENVFWMENLKTDNLPFDYDDKTVVVAKSVNGDYW